MRKPSAGAWRGPRRGAAWAPDLVGLRRTAHIVIVPARPDGAVRFPQPARVGKLAKSALLKRAAHRALWVRVPPRASGGSPVNPVLQRDDGVLVFLRVRRAISSSHAGRCRS